MFSKLTMSLAVTMALVLANNASAQTKKAAPKKAANAKAVDARKAEDSRSAAAAANKKAEEEKALEARRLEEAKTAAAKAEESATNTGFLGYVKSHFTATYHGEYYFQRTDSTSDDPKKRELQNLRILHNPTIIYRPVKNYKLLVTSEFTYSDNGNAGKFINRHYRDLILLTRENILTEKENGLKMDVGVGRRIFDRNHSKQQSYGNSRINTTLSKKFLDDKLSSSILVQYLKNDPASHKIKNGTTKRIKPTTWEHSLELIPTLNWQITDKLSYLFNDDFILNTSYSKDNYSDTDFSHEMNIGFVTYQFNDKNAAYFQLKYLRFSNVDADDLNVGPFQKNRNTDDWFEYYIGYIYNITPKFTVTGEVGSKFLGASDGRDGFSKEIAYPEVALYLDITL
jgi:hypothetical protein